MEHTLLSIALDEFHPEHEEQFGALLNILRNTGAFQESFRELIWVLYELLHLLLELPPAALLAFALAFLFLLALLCALFVAAAILLLELIHSTLGCPHGEAHSKALHVHKHPAIALRLHLNYLVHEDPPVTGAVEEGRKTTFSTALVLAAALAAIFAAV